MNVVSFAIVECRLPTATAPQRLHRAPMEARRSIGGTSDVDHGDRLGGDREAVRERVCVEIVVDDRPAGQIDRPVRRVLDPAVALVSDPCVLAERLVGIRGCDPDVRRCGVRCRPGEDRAERDRRSSQCDQQPHPRTVVHGIDLLVQGAPCILAATRPSPAIIRTSPPRTTSRGSDGTVRERGRLQRTPESWTFGCGAGKMRAAQSL